MIRRLSPGTRNRGRVGESRFGFCLLLALLLATCPQSAISTQATTMTEELKTSLIPIVNYIRQYYIDEISPDTLMQAGLRGIFHALDPASEFTIKGEVDCGPEDMTCRWTRNFSDFEIAVRAVDVIASRSMRRSASHRSWMSTMVVIRTSRADVTVGSGVAARS